MDAYFSGEKLYGDDFSPQEIEAWYEQEKEACAEIAVASSGDYLGRDHVSNYGYHALNWFHGYGRLPGDQRFPLCLGLGAAYGAEFFPIVARIDAIDIVEPSAEFHKYSDLQGVPVRYHVPIPSGELPFEDRRFHLTTCLGCLHHIPNVSMVVSELHRVCTKGGFVLVREPISSMGDWRGDRPHGTRNERGIPIRIFDRIVQESGFTMYRRSFCGFSPFVRLWDRLLKTSPFASPVGTRLDWIQSRLMGWNHVYHRTRVWHKFSPGSVFYVLRRDQ